MKNETHSVRPWIAALTKNSEEAVLVAPGIVAYRIPGATVTRSWQVEVDCVRICRPKTTPGALGAHLFTREEAIEAAEKEAMTA